MVDNLLIIALLLGGLVLMIKSADYFVDSAVKIAEISGIPKIIVGATIVSLATTLPELFVSTTAILEGKNEMAVGNALGSVIFNTAIVLSVASIFMAGKVDRKNIMKKGILLFLALITFVIFAGNDLNVNRTEGFALFAFIIIYTYMNIMSVKKQKLMVDRVVVENKTKQYVKHFAILIISAVGIRYGAKFLVEGAILIAEMSGASEQVIGLTVLAMGTSLPEFATTVTSIIKKEQGLSVGNILGANILNITLILGTAGIISRGGLQINKLDLIGFDRPVPQTMFLDIPFIFIVLILFMLPVFIKGKLYKWQGIVGLGLYSAYLTYLLMNA